MMESAGLSFENWMSILYDISLLGILFGGGFWFLARLDFRIRELMLDRKTDTEAYKLRFDKIEDELQKLIAATVQLARQEERLNAIDGRLGDLSKRIEANRAFASKATKRTKA